MFQTYENVKEILTLRKAFEKDGRNLLPEDLSVRKNATIIFDEEKILWLGDHQEYLDVKKSEFEIEKRFDGSKLIITPEIVDSHTHLVFGGNRSNEYLMRLDGKSYEEIAKAGGGIQSTVNSTRSLSEDDLFEVAFERVENLYSYGIGTIEIKSGYGLDYESEKKLSTVIQRLKEAFAPEVQIFNTYMAAHAIPKEYNKDADRYLDEVVVPLMEELKKDNIIDAVDIFQEEGYFNKDHTIKVFQKAKELKLPLKIHADEFCDSGGAEVAMEFEALSADHLLQTSSETIKKFKNSNTVATLLPGTSLFLGKNFAKGREFYDSGARVSLASDYNPGSCHFDNLLMIASMAATQFKTNQCELWSSITLNAAKSLGLNEQGAIKEGLSSRFSVFKANTYAEISYFWGKNFSIMPPHLNS
ncbi:MAG: imidazolonepropionase [Bacteriovoracaceae bacterium]